MIYKNEKCRIMSKKEDEKCNPNLGLHIYGLNNILVMEPKF